jgi:hypothetical protein
VCAVRMKACIMCRFDICTDRKLPRTHEINLEKPYMSFRFNCEQRERERKSFSNTSSSNNNAKLYSTYDSAISDRLRIETYFQLSRAISFFARNTRSTCESKIAYIVARGSGVCLSNCIIRSAERFTCKCCSFFFLLAGLARCISARASACRREVGRRESDSERRPGIGNCHKFVHSTPEENVSSCARESERNVLAHGQNVL